MAFEIEFLAVGEGSRAGDCILVRYGHPQAPRVMVVDGGTQDAGAALVELLQGPTGAATPVVHDLLVSHPDADHASGALAILGPQGCVGCSVEMGCAPGSPCVRVYRARRPLSCSDPNSV